MNIEPKTLKRIIVAVVVVPFLLLVYRYVATHGTLIIDASDGTYTVQKAEKGKNGLSEKKTLEGNRATVTTGAYIVEYKSGGSQFITYVNAPSFLRSVTVTFKRPVQRLVERVASSTLDQIVQGSDNTIVGVNTLQQIGMTLVHPSGDPTGLSAQVGSTPITGTKNLISNNALTGFAPTSTSSLVQPIHYDFANQATSTATQTYLDNSDMYLIPPSSANSDMYGMYYAEGRTFSLDIYDKVTLKQTFHNLSGVADGEGTKAIGISSRYVAVGTGPNYLNITNDSLEGDLGELKEYRIKIYDLDTTKEVRSIRIGKTNTIESIQISDDGRYVAATEDSELKIYDTHSGKQIFSYSTSSILSPQWLDNDRLLFGSVENGLFELNARKQSAVNLLPSGSLRLSSFNVFGDRVLFTAYSQKDTSDSLSPDGYVAYLDKESNDNNVLIQKLPYENSQFKLTSLNNAIYAAPVVDGYTGTDPEFHKNAPSESFKNAVRTYLEKNIQDYERYTIVYGENL